MLPEIFTALLHKYAPFRDKLFLDSYRPSQMDVDRETVLGVAIRYELDGPAIENRWGQDFPHPPRPHLRPNRASCIMGTRPPSGAGGGGGGPERRVHHPPPPSAEGKVTEQLNLYYSPGTSWPVTGRNSSQMDSCVSLHIPSQDHLNPHNTD
jgi:hypothetical protein